MNSIGLKILEDLEYCSNLKDFIIFLSISVSPPDLQLTYVFGDGPLCIRRADELLTLLNLDNCVGLLKPQ